ncbi:4'-phosphopantetheinyl transferase superfamily protein [Tumebacillus sp. DT12]|uniref:4'-phosphopantetheinyl transferase superfamily protein n=1 Tax=Tumebacillus lacus TaxID=2995335 RepID=A0ABT3X2E4_9BACL|nr:4'-phosphopantetheinyl transferase superfamily protein [Tumebacillus lacus]MCX7571083.1 4'-phosphopantetheinyl transferase superfamily protein [Tumebacillus lacus]
MTVWHPLPERYLLSEDDVHVWRIELVQSDAVVERLYSLLSADELAKANRYRFEKDRRAYTVGRGALRILLGRYLEVPPRELRFVYGEHGKPMLDPEARHGTVPFNLSNSKDLALVGITLNREIGVDLEYGRDLSDMEMIVERFFSQGEIDVLLNLPQEQRHAAFYECWSRKEAYLKALGSGLAQPLGSFTVTLAPGEPARLLDVVDDPAEVRRWGMQELDVHPEYGAAICVEGQEFELKCFEWRP